MEQKVLPPVRMTSGWYECECGATWGAVFHTVPMRRHWVPCPKCSKLVWPYRMELF